MRLNPLTNGVAHPFNPLTIGVGVLHVVYVRMSHSAFIRACDRHALGMAALRLSLLVPRVITGRGSVAYGRLNHDHHSGCCGDGGCDYQDCNHNRLLLCFFLDSNGLPPSSVSRSGKPLTVYTHVKVLRVLVAVVEYFYSDPHDYHARKNK